MVTEQFRVTEQVRERSEKGQRTRSMNGRLTVNELLRMIDER